MVRFEAHKTVQPVCHETSRTLGRPRKGRDGDLRPARGGLPQRPMTDGQGRRVAGLGDPGRHCHGAHAPDATPDG